MMTYSDERNEDDEAESRKVGNKGWSPEQLEKIFKGACLFWHNAEERNEDGAAGNENRPQNHPRGEYVSQKNAGEECIP